MTRRLTVAIVGMVLFTITVTGVGLYANASLGASADTRAVVVRAVEQIRFFNTRQANRILREGLDEGAGRQRVPTVENAALYFAVLDTDDTITIVREVGDPRSPRPTQRIDVADLVFSAERLREGEIDVVERDNTFFAAATVEAATLPEEFEGSGVVIAARRTGVTLGQPWRSFLWSGAAAIALGAIVAWALGRRLAHPLVAVEAATQQIAAGDLSARVQKVSGNDEVASLASSVNSMAESLERSRGVEQQFLLSVSHDLRTPLTSIRGYAEALADGTLDDARAGGAVIQTEARRLERLVRDLLDLAKLDAAEFRFEPQQFDLTELALDAASAVSFDAADLAVDLTVHEAAEIEVVADRDRLGQVVANLLENGLKYAETTVEVATGDDGTPWLTVTDDGPGIPEEDLEHVFERLYVTQHRPRRKEQGSGLGLAIARDLLSAMGGTITAERAPVGTRMVIRLPRPTG